jgi:hypothetical protein
LNAPRTHRVKSFVETFVKSSFVKIAAVLLLLMPLAAHVARAQGPAAAQPPQKAQAAPEVATTTAATPSPTPARATRTVLTGRVVSDSGEPLTDVAVSLSSRALGPRRVGPPYTVGVDEGGNFRFEGLDPGLYEVFASLPGFAVETDPLTGRPFGPYQPGDNVTVRLVKGGVVTGTVTDQQGQPVAALNVRAVRVRDLDGATPPLPFLSTVDDRTDDRGAYRIYGLRPGLYVVYAGGNAPFPSFAGVGEAPTFYPSGTRDTAAEVSIRAGQEAAGIDIRLREEPARRVSGTIDSPAGVPGDFGIGVSLTYASTAVPVGTAFMNVNNSPDRFFFDGIADGEYDLQATSNGREGLMLASAPQRISVRGADVTGLRLTLMTLASASGTIRFEPAAEAGRPAPEACKAVRASQLPQETLVTAEPAVPARPNTPGRVFSRVAVAQGTTPDNAGAFTVRSLEANRYRLSVRVFDEALYVRSIQTPAPAVTPQKAAPQRAAATTATAASRDLFDVKAGQQLSGLLVRVAEGAASFGGSITAADPAAGAALSQLHVHLVPQERERAEDALRYYEATVSGDGTFSFKHLAPGRYLVLVRPFVVEAGESAPRPAALDAGTRAALRREAETANTAVELQPCQRTTDFALRFPPLAAK